MTAAPSPPVAALPEPRELIDHLDLHVTEHDNHHAGLALRFAWPAVKDYIDALRAVASGLGAQVKLRDELLKEMSEEDEAIRKMVADFDTTDSLNYDDTAAIVERAIYGYKTEIAAAEASAQSAVARVAELERDAMRYRWLREYAKPKIIVEAIPVDSRQTVYEATIYANSWDEMNESIDKSINKVAALKA